MFGKFNQTTAEIAIIYHSKKTKTNMTKLTQIQNELKVPKGNFNSFGKYKYRSAEDILEAVKPILAKHDVTLILTDEVVSIGTKLFLKATATLDDVIKVCGFAELSEHKGMSAEQCTGTASSYARKYALNGLFLIDETEADADSQKPKNDDKPFLTDDQFKKAIISIQQGKKDAVLAHLKNFTLTESQQATLDIAINGKL